MRRSSCKANSIHPNQLEAFLGDYFVITIVFTDVTLLTIKTLYNDTFRQGKVILEPSGTLKR